MATISHWLRVFGVDVKRALGALRGVAKFSRDKRGFRGGDLSGFTWGECLPVLDEWGESSGGVGAYFQQDLLVARWIHEARPARHVDIGSRIDGFVGHLAVFREVEVLDIRPQPAVVRNVRFHQIDLMAELPEEWCGATDSLSCLHTIEHFGLGRYGDPIATDGYRKGLAQMMRMVAPGGMFYLSVPMGPQRVEFNAHRVFSAATLLGWFRVGWRIERFAYIDDEDRVVEVPVRTDEAIAGNFGCRMGVGIVAARRMF